MIEAKRTGQIPILITEPKKPLKREMQEELSQLRDMLEEKILHDLALAVFPVDLPGWMCGPSKGNRIFWIQIVKGPSGNFYHILKDFEEQVIRITPILRMDLDPRTIQMLEEKEGGF